MSKKYKNQSTNNIIRGFTLVELLAIIVLLAIIATIGVPIFLKTINKSKTTSFERRADLYVEAAEVAIATENLDGTFNPKQCIVQTDGNLICDENTQLEVEMKGEKPKYGTLTISGGKVTNFVDLKFEDKFVTMGENGKHTVSDKKSVKMITFNLGSMECQAEEGMTWADFIDSEYNTYGFTSEDSLIFIESEWGMPIIDIETGEEVSPTTVIKPNGKYGVNCCFDAGTQVLMSDGTTKNIEDVKVGDMVMSYNTVTHEFEPKKVLRTITKHHSDDLVYVNLSNGKRIGMRAYHPLLTTEGYKSLRPEFAQTKIEAGKIEKLQVGDTLIGYEANVTITSIEQRNPIKNYDTYNLEVEDNHNYIVNGVVAHNYTDCKPLKPIESVY